MDDMLSSLAMADDPLLLGLRVWAGNAEPMNHLGLLIDLLRVHGRQCSIAAAREIARLAQRLTLRAGGAAQRLLAALDAMSDIAAEQWLRASLLETLGSPAEAMVIYETLPDPGPFDGRSFRLLACARTMANCGRLGPAADALREAIRCASTFRMLQGAGKLVDHLAQFGNPHIKRDARIALIGTTTLSALGPALRSLAFAGGIRAEVYVGAIHQYQQEILDPASPLAAFDPDVVILAPHWQSLGLPDDADDPEATIHTTLVMLRNLWRHCRDRLGAVVIQHNFEIPSNEPYGRLSQSLPGGRSRMVQRINLALWDAERQEQNVVIVDLDQIAAQYGKVFWNDAAFWHAAKQYPSVDAILPLLRQDIAALQGLWGLTAKCLVLDLDNTLWDGVIGEDGMSGIGLGGTGVGEAYSTFQQYVRGLGHRGVILSVCSKNNMEDVQQVFRDHPEMVLRADDVGMFEVNWRPKDEGLRHIAEVLNIGLDSIVFVDDSPQERAWVRQRLPEVIVPELPADPALFVQAVASGLYFETLTLTDEDRRRAHMYHGNAQRGAMLASSANVEDFLQSLRMSIALRPFEDVDLPRIVQLLNKTNQFNVTSRRWPETHIRHLMTLPSVYTQAVRVRDRFGDNGLTGLLIAREEGGQFIIDTWLLSCRVMGRHVEDVMFDSLWRQAQARRISAVTGDLILTVKNVPVRDLYDRLGFALVHEYPNGDRRYQRLLKDDAPPLPSFFEVDDQTIARDLKG